MRRVCGSQHEAVIQGKTTLEDSLPSIVKRNSTPWIEAAKVAAATVVKDEDITNIPPAISGKLLNPFYPRKVQAPVAGSTINGSPHGRSGHGHIDASFGGGAIDLAYPEGTPVVAASDAVFYKMNRRRVDSGDNNFMWFEAMGYFFIYAHVKKDPSLQVGDSVKRGQFVGRLGRLADGWSHLHLQIWKKPGR